MMQFADVGLLNSCTIFRSYNIFLNTFEVCFIHNKLLQFSYSKFGIN